jgi:hypothetical protein
MMTPPIPTELCGEHGCVYLAGHVEAGNLPHSWELVLSW